MTKEKNTEIAGGNKLEACEAKRKKFERLFSAFKKNPTYEGYEKASKTLAELHEELKKRSHETTPTQKELDELAKMESRYFGDRIHSLLAHSLQICREGLFRKDNLEERIRLHGVLCLILQDGIAYYEDNNIPAFKGAIMQYRIDALELLRDNHRYIQTHLEQNPKHAKAEKHYQEEIAKLRSDK